MSGKQSQPGVNIMEIEGTASPEPKRRRAAQYVRMSTEHQQYSTENQSDVIRDYADKRMYEIIRTYARASAH